MLLNVLCRGTRSITRVDVPPAPKRKQILVEERGCSLVDKRGRSWKKIDNCKTRNDSLSRRSSRHVDFWIFSIIYYMRNLSFSLNGRSRCVKSIFQKQNRFRKKRMNEKRYYFVYLYIFDWWNWIEDAEEREYERGMRCEWLEVIWNLDGIVRKKKERISKNK